MADAQNPCNKEPVFGQRYLEDESTVFVHNAWDDVEWPEEEERRAMAIVEAQKLAAADNRSTANNLLDSAHENWDSFYATHANRFFMDRKWIAREFPEVFERLAEKRQVRALDVGCGVGNTMFPLLSAVDDENLFMYSCDFSSTAIKTLRESEHFNADKCRAFVWNVASDDQTIPEAEGIEAGSLDFILCIYVLSAIPPEMHSKALQNLSRLLAPGGVLFVKDYARYDLTQLRFKAHRLIRDNFYARGDGTLVYFFAADELDALLVTAGLAKVQNRIDKRLIVNRAKQVKMYRRWLQCKYVKTTLP